MDSIQHLLDEIKSFDCEPRIFKVYLMAASHLEGFGAVADFRTYDPENIRELHVHGETPEAALQILLSQLTIRFGKCPQCGNYRDKRVPDAN